MHGSTVVVVAVVVVVVAVMMMVAVVTFFTGLIVRQERDLPRQGAGLMAHRQRCSSQFPSCIMHLFKVAPIAAYAL